MDLGDCLKKEQHSAALAFACGVSIVASALLSQAREEHDSLATGVQEELKIAHEQNRNLEEQLLASRVNQERLEDSIVVAETEQAVAQETIKAQEATIDKSTLELEHLQAESARLQGLVRKLEISLGTAEKVGRSC